MGIIEVAIGRFCVFPVLTKAEGQTDKKIESGKNQALDVNGTYTFNVSKIVKIFEYLFKERFITHPVHHYIPLGHYIPSTPKIKRKEQYRYYDVWTHLIVNYWIVIQDRINKEILKFLEKLKETMQVDEHSFPFITNIQMTSYDKS